MDDLKSRIAILCKANNISICALEKKLQMGHGSIYKVTEDMSAQKAHEIAKYFNVSVEYLLTGEDPDISPVHLNPVTDFEYGIISAYRNKSRELQNAVCKILDVEYADNLKIQEICDSMGTAMPESWKKLCESIGYHI